MCDKKLLKIYMADKHILGFFSFMPIFAGIVCLIIEYFTFKSYATAAERYFVMNPYISFIFPITGVLTPILIYQKYIEQADSGLYCVYCKSHGYIFLFSIMEFFLLLVPFLIIHSICNSYLFLSTLRIGIATISLLMVNYVIVKLVKSTVFSLCVTFIYQAFVCFIYKGERNPLIWFYNIENSKEYWIHILIPEFAFCLFIVLFMRFYYSRS